MRIGGDTTSEWTSARFRPGQPGVRGARPEATPEQVAREVPGTSRGHSAQVPGTSPVDDLQVPGTSRGEDSQVPGTSAVEGGRKPGGGAKAGGELTDKERDQVARLRARDAEVRAHEAAHAAAAGAFGGGASYTYATGPDGNRYAVGGEVPVRISSGSTPEEAIRNAAQIRAAALAPAEPSGQDQAVAAEAAAMEASARMELAARRTAETEAAMAPRRDEESTPVRPSESRTSAPGETNDVTAAAAEAQRRPEPAQDVRPTPDPEAIMQKLEQEQMASRGSWRHMHMSSGCGSCAAAISSYS